MRRAVFSVIAVGLVALVVVGYLDSRESSGTTTARAPGAAQTARALAGSPPALAALHAQSARLLGGGLGAYAARLRALRGHPVVVNLWTSWCGPCREELPVFQRASVQLGRRVAFVGVDEQDNAGDAAHFLRQRPLSYPSFQDPDGTLGRRLHVQGLPTTLFYDARGRLQAYVHQGPYESVADLRADVRRYAVRG